MAIHVEDFFEWRPSESNSGQRHDDLKENLPSFPEDLNNILLLHDPNLHKQALSMAIQFAKNKLLQSAHHYQDDYPTALILCKPHALDHLTHDLSPDNGEQNVVHDLAAPQGSVLIPASSDDNTSGIHTNMVGPGYRQDNEGREAASPCLSISQRIKIRYLGCAADFVQYCACMHLIPDDQLPVVVIVLGIMGYTEGSGSSRYPDSNNRTFNEPSHQPRQKEAKLVHLLGLLTEGVESIRSVSSQRKALAAGAGPLKFKRQGTISLLVVEESAFTSSSASSTSALAASVPGFEAGSCCQSCYGNDRGG
ncbi:hypothetical protein CEUSTIGMA_g7907.t1 [Chlamydomonas eustigma]|uniref:Uncharacterized protein n=1 Tax=Chlamydomonas eustigma TaxID=1157962 RepID=A0A250XBL3_9CHLO|nr:hypothetical protein CEUSTIGMA_g7907.t1 [Chlamydomonas eustigma]|eukprot:GAX80468.1 hypothetical protein CEUSTIGMA_g7907.t1 [Chlamydomonas eustigma]